MEAQLLDNRYFKSDEIKLSWLAGKLLFDLK